MNKVDEVGSRQHYRVVARAIDYLQAHADQPPSLEALAQAVHMSPHHLQRVFTRWAGISPKRFMQYLSKERAIRALRETDDLLSASEAAGLSSPGRLHDLMVSCEAMTPAEVRAAGAGVELSYGLAPTPFGEALLGWTARGVCYLAFVDEDRSSRLQELATLWRGAQRSEDGAGALELVGRIFPTQGQPEPLRLLLRGTNFQIKVWEALLRCDSSHPISYGQLATRIGSPRAQRAVGSALAANTIGYLIPCHRVIRESGELGSYRWGVTRKRAMLMREALERDFSG
ncbi:methylated-DNA--[protein]-cysteine S-methyltransferase [Aestuariirhabdus litorea]|uniref:Methylated-DNA--[protein]-cysteine S-methyltransferase n=1 Tax=Aestuariirhabdus litorea TaxID=2528527 RepID=A0A3P3VPA3_9GAMM|nr:methylated-DNA--[protein]-cysteine S-methyltransferase [Aestuariirhabdus litorea]RRJ82643.1 methylated-DNA--[protein]-cysteine S-methyltransferase [Aestuariirhabdus litorea]RWW92804.1 methylated-DNA--[protein]-cysteine S-methyltransferase [Endozoicomonadaceae bacterium GTF-13]